SGLGRMILVANERRWTGFALRRSRARADRRGTRSTRQASEARVRGLRCAKPSAARGLRASTTSPCWQSSHEFSPTNVDGHGDPPVVAMEIATLPWRDL